MKLYLYYPLHVLTSYDEMIGKGNRFETYHHRYKIDHNFLANVSISQ